MKIKKGKTLAVVFHDTKIGYEQAENGKFAITIKGKHSYITDFEYDECKKISDFAVCVAKKINGETRYGIINYKAQMFPCIFKSISPYNCEYICATAEDNQRYIINTNWGSVCTYEFQKLKEKYEREKEIRERERKEQEERERRRNRW